MPHRKAQQHQGIGLGKIPTKYSLLVLLATIFLIIVATIGGKNLYFRGDYDIFFDGTNKQLLAFDEIQTTFAKTDNLAIVIAPEDGDIFTPQTLSLIQKITVDAWQVPYSVVLTLSLTINTQKPLTMICWLKIFYTVNTN